MAESILDRIVTAVRDRMAAEPEPIDLAERATRVREGLPRRSLREALSAEGPSVIAECKKASPSAGLLRADVDPARLAARYESAGASAISVVTEPTFSRAASSGSRRYARRSIFPFCERTSSSTSGSFVRRRPPARTQCC